MSTKTYSLNNTLLQKINTIRFLKYNYKYDIHIYIIAESKSRKID